MWVLTEFSAGFGRIVRYVYLAFGLRFQGFGRVDAAVFCAPPSSVNRITILDSTFFWGMVRL